MPRTLLGVQRRSPTRVSTAKQFEIPVADGLSAAEVLVRAREAAKGAGISISGDESSGRFQGTADGTYAVDADARLVRVEVTNKPSFVPWGMVEGALRKVFG
jgi:hypothetical protein